ncbi:glycosyltransferase [Sphingomonas sp. AOB5]|uniref:glycosyltransferase family 2 protein n=1 Tax=Sphingomonas sp. AOB5 TaxID=3034017 RepID=UPI0023F76CCD|nr:glycosyltransferase [Sphingomonas sp. AOB5]MDF7776966.1 glycosyltransferase [Sphingomonas sp. AOB5]
MPAVSVIMAVYNGAALLPETIASLHAQSFTDWELIAVDDCSKDESVAVLESYADPRIRVIRAATNGGPVVARNLAFAEARGRYCAALDQDDISLPDRFAKQVAFLDAHPDTVLVSTATNFLQDGEISPGNWPRPMTPELIDWLMLVQNPIAWSSVMFRTDAARRLTPFERPKMRYVEDFDFYHRIRAFGRLAQIDEVLLHYRIHAGGASNMFNATMRDHARKLLRERHREWLGEDAPDFTALLVEHVMAREPVPDGETLERLFEGIAMLRAAFEVRFKPDRRTAVLVDREISRLWWRLCRAGVRSGRIALHQAVARWPEGVSKREGSVTDLAVSQVIGGMRAVKRGLAG